MITQLSLFKKIDKSSHRKCSLWRVRYWAIINNPKSLRKFMRYRGSERIEYACSAFQSMYLGVIYTKYIYDFITFSTPTLRLLWSRYTYAKQRIGWDSIKYKVKLHTIHMRERRARWNAC